MPAITYAQFDVGLDHRKSADTAEANRLRVLKNAYVTTGKQIRKRPGLSRVAELEAGTVGLIAAEGKLNTFYANGTITHANSLFFARKVPHPTSSAIDISDVHYGDMFYGYLYCAIEYSDGSVRHHYLDDPGVWAAATAYTVGTFRRPTTANGFRYEVTAIAGTGTSAGAEPTWPTTVGLTVIDNPGANQITWTCRSYSVVDANCPHTKSAAKASSKIYAVNGSVVRFCATAAARDWTTASDAGFLAVGSQQQGAQEALVLAPFQEDLGVFFIDGVQIWDTDPDPALTVLRQRIHNIGTRYRRSPLQLSGDTFFLSDVGFRSITLSSVSENLQDADVGSPIDALVVPTLTTNLNPISVWYPRAGQFWCLIGTTAWVYTFSRVSKIAAWSQYEFPFSVTAAASLNGQLYVRAGNVVYQVIDTQYTDDGVLIDVDIELPYVDFKAPGALKQIIGIDALLEGTANAQIRYDPRNTALITDAIPLSGNTTPGTMTPVEMCAVQVAPRITHSADEAFSLNALTFYWESLGAT